MKIEDIRELCKEAHENAVRHGFWDEEHDIRHYLMLVITELAEAVQAYRKNKFADRNEYEKLVKERGCARGDGIPTEREGHFRGRDGRHLHTAHGLGWPERCRISG